MCKKYLMELAVVTMDFAKACGRMFEQEHLGFIAMLTATRTSGGGGAFHIGVIEHNVIMNLIAVGGDKSVSRQWRHEFTTAFGHVGGVREEIVDRLVEDGNERRLRK